MNTVQIYLLLSLLLSGFMTHVVRGVELVSTSNPQAGKHATANRDSGGAWLSPDGRYLTFASSATDLTTNPAVNSVNVYWRDRQAGLTRLLSASTNGTTGGNGNSWNAIGSSNGLMVAFQSNAENLVPNDTNACTDIFIRDATHGTALLASVNTNGMSGNSHSRNALLSEDGRFVCFESLAKDLVPSITITGSGPVHVYVRDLVNQTTVLASLDTNDMYFGDGVDQVEDMTPDGRFVLFSLTAKPPGYMYLAPFLYVRDMVANKTIWVNQLNPVRAGNNDCIDAASLSADGRFAVYAYNQQTGYGSLVRVELTTGKTNIISKSNGRFINSISLSADGEQVLFAASPTPSSSFTPITNQIYLWKSADTNLALVSVAADGTNKANGDCAPSLLNPDGTRAVFFSKATNLTTNMVNGCYQAYMRDLVTGETRLLSRSAEEDRSESTIDGYPCMSTDGRWIAFESNDDTLTPQDSNECFDVFLYDWENSTLEPISVQAPAWSSTTANGGSCLNINALSTEGRFVLFTSQANDLSPLDDNENEDVYLKDTTTGGIELVSVNAAGNHSGAGSSWNPSLSADGRFAAFQSDAADLVQNDTNRTTDVFLRDLATHTTHLVSHDLTGTKSASHASTSPIITSNGAFVIYQSFATNIHSSATSASYTHLFAYEVSTGTNHLITSTNAISNFIVSPNGRWVAFKAGPHTPFFVHDLVCHSNILVNVGATYIGPFSSDGQWLIVNEEVNSSISSISWYNLISRMTLLRSFGSISYVQPIILNQDGSHALFRAISRSSETNGQVFDIERDTGKITLVSMTPEQTPSTNTSSRPLWINPWGTYAIFQSAAADLVPDDTNGYTDIFGRDLIKGTTELLSRSATGTGSGSCQSGKGFVCADGSRLVFESFASDLVAGDANNTRDIFTLGLTPSNVDSDADGLLDGWELKYFGDLTHDGTADTDGDGSTDLQEYQAGNDPVVASPALVLQYHVRRYTFSWNGVYGKTYQIEHTPSLENPAWAGYTPWITITNKTTSYFNYDMGFTQPEAGFYRIHQLP